MNLFKKLVLLTALLCSSAFAQQSESMERIGIGCRVLLSPTEYIIQNEDVYIKNSTLHEICSELSLQDFDAWEIIDYHIFIYIECPECHAAHLIDHACPNCKVHRA